MTHNVLSNSLLFTRSNTGNQSFVTVCSGCLLVMALVIARPVYGQSSDAIPDAGVLQRQIESARQSALPAASVPSLAPVSPAVDDNQPKARVNSFELNGAKLIDRHELLALIQNQIGQLLTFNQLEQLTQQIAEYYRSKGWFARVYLPEQDVGAGNVKIEIIEADFSGSKLEAADTRADTDLVTSIVLGDLKPGAPFAVKQLESGLLKANDMPGIKATGILEPGESPGQTGVRLKIEDLPLATGYLNYANQGIRSTGSNQYQGDLQINDPFGRGDQFTVHALGSENLVSVRSEYGLTVGSHGERFSVYGSHLQYQLGGSFAKLQAEGEARNIGGVFSYPFIRETTRNLNLRIGIDNKLNQSSQLGQLTRLRDINTLSLTINGDQIDHWLESALNAGSLQFTAGNLNPDGVASDLSSDSKTANARGDFYRLNFNLSRLQNLADQWQISFAFSGQWASKNLDSSQKFSLGGPAGVRAYPVNEGMGDSGWLINFEIRRNLGYGFQGLMFADTGGIQVSQQPWSSAPSSTPNSYLLSGVGLGLRWTYSNQWQAAATVGLPLTTNPARDVYNHNSDGTRASDPSGWLSLTRYF